MRQMKKLLSALLCAALLAGLLPATALAAEASWAADAVSKLNGIYGSGVFSAEDTGMTEGDLNALITATGWNTTVSLGNENLTRDTACEVLADVFDLPIGSQSAIQYLYDQNIISGKADGDLDADGNVTFAEFAVLTYRVLNAVGGGMGSSISLKPGTEEYFAWMYLAARGCVPFQSSQIDAACQSVRLKNIGSNQVADAPDGDTSAVTWGEFWLRWIDTLKGLENVDLENDDLQTPDDNTPLLEAVTSIVDAYIQKGGSKTIFSDVPTDSPYYDGVMYLFDQGLVNGNGNGTFAPGRELSRQELAVLLYRHGETNPVSGAEGLQAAKAYAQTNGYLTPPADGADAWWAATATREEAIVAIVKACADGTAVNNANTDVLGRFSDGNTVSADAAQSIAYAVSIGILNGNQNGTLGLSTGATRGQAGVLLYRTLIGLDTSKMKDYADSVEYATAEGDTSTVSAFSSIAALSSSNTLTLREDWRLTGILDLNAGVDDTLTIQGNGHHIYEMGGKLTNSTVGTVTFADGTILYPAAGDANAEKITPEGIWDTKESNALMALRAGGYTVKISDTTNGTVTVDKLAAKAGDTVTLTVTPNSGYTLDTLKVTYGSETADVEISNNTFTMPAGDVIISATFASKPVVVPEKPAAPTFSPTGGTYTSSQSVTISATSGAAIYYTTNGDTPSTSSTLYTGPITISSTTTLKAIAVNDNLSSEVATASYTIRTGGGSGSGGSGGGSSSSTTTETTTNPDGSTTTTVTNNTTGTVTETTKFPNGSTEVVEAKKDGTVTTTTTDTEGDKTKVVETPDGTTETTMDRTDGSRSVTTVDENGLVVSEASLTTAAIETAAVAGQPAALPLPTLSVSNDRETAPTVTVTLPAGTTQAKIAIPVADVTPGAVALLVDTDGTEAVIPTTLTGQACVVVTLQSGQTVKVVDNTKTFADVSDSYWGADAVAFASSRELFQGTSSTTFSPESPMTRAMIVTVLARLEGVDTDTGENWYDAGAQWAVEAGISDGSNLDQNLSREQLATMLWRYAGNPVPTASLDAYHDASSISSYAQQAMAWAVETGLIRGITDDTLRPQGQATRAQVSTILMRFIEATA